MRRICRGIGHEGRLQSKAVQPLLLASHSKRAALVSHGCHYISGSRVAPEQTSRTTSMLPCPSSKNDLRSMGASPSLIESLRFTTPRNASGKCGQVEARAGTQRALSTPSPRIQVPPRSSYPSTRFHRLVGPTLVALITRLHGAHDGRYWFAPVSLRPPISEGATLVALFIIAGWFLPREPVSADPPGRLFR